MLLNFILCLRRDKLLTRLRRLAPVSLLRGQKRLLVSSTNIRIYLSRQFCAKQNRSVLLSGKVA